MFLLNPISSINYTEDSSYFKAGGQEWGFVSPTPKGEIVKQDYIFFNMSLLEKCVAGEGGLKIEINGINTSICSECPLNYPGYYQHNQTGLGDGNKTYNLWCNNVKRDNNWTFIEKSNSSLLIIPRSPPNNFHWINNTHSINLTCEAFAPSGIVNITLKGDFKNIKYEMLYQDTYSPPNPTTNLTANFTVTNLIINDTYNWYCEVVSNFGNKKMSDNNVVNLGKGKVYVVFAVDTETNEGGDIDPSFATNLDLSNYQVQSGWKGSTIELFNPAWRESIVDSKGGHPKITWYLMTHEGYCFSDKGCNVIPNLMYNQDNSTSDFYPSNISYWGDEYGWHNHHSFWNGYSEEDSEGKWEKLHSYNGTEIFWRNGINETDIIRAEKIASLFIHDNLLSWPSFRAGWLWTDNNYLENLISKITPLNFGGFPSFSGDIWGPDIQYYEDRKIYTFKCAPGEITSEQVDAGFSSADNGSIVIMCGYGHNYPPGTKIIIDRSTDLIENSSLSYDVDYEYATALEASQAYFRISDKTPPSLDFNIQDNQIIVYSNENLSFPPVLSILINDGITTNYTLAFMNQTGEREYIFNKSAYPHNIQNITIRAIDKGFNVKTIKIPLDNIPYFCGDVNNDKKINALDITYLINYLYKGEPAPFPEPKLGDVNNDKKINALDITYLINYLYKGGSPPIEQPGICKNSPIKMF